MRPKSFERHLLICCMQVCVLVAVQLEHCTQGGAWHVGREEEGVERVHKCANNEVCANLERVKSFSHLTLPSLAPSLAPSLSSPTLQHPDPPSLSLSPASLGAASPTTPLTPRYGGEGGGGGGGGGVIRLFYRGNQGACGQARARQSGHTRVRAAPRSPVVGQSTLLVLDPPFRKYLPFAPP
jgi:hypothetical protein